MGGVRIVLLDILQKISSGTAVEVARQEGDGVYRVWNGSAEDYPLKHYHLLYQPVVSMEITRNEQSYTQQIRIIVLDGGAEDETV